MSYNFAEIFDENLYYTSEGTITTSDGSATINNAGVWDGTNAASGWSMLDGGINSGYTRGWHIVDANRIYIYGAFSSIGDSVTVSQGSNFSVAMWDGTKWNSLGTLGTTNNVVFGVCYDSTNDLLYAVGQFTQIYGVSANRVAVFNGTSWSAMGAGANSTVYSCALDGNNDLYIGGAFGAVTNVSSVSNTTGIAKWDSSESTWVSVVTASVANIRAMHYDSDENDLYVGGSFSSANGVSNTRALAKFDITADTWSSIGTFSSGTIYSIEYVGSGALYIGGQFDDNGTDVAYRNSGGTWTDLGTTDTYTYDPDVGDNFVPLDITADTNGNVFAVRNAGGLYVLQDGTTVWRRISELTGNITLGDIPSGEVATIPDLTASSTSEVLTNGTAMTNITITNTGTSATFSISPSLPSGLSLNTSNGTISGTPSAESSETTYTVTATNGAGSDTVDITLTVNLVIPDISISSSSETLTKDEAMTNITITNGGDDATFTISPSLPSGLSISSSTGTISGTPTAIVVSFATHTITATNSGGTDTVDVSLRVHDSYITAALSAGNSASVTNNANGTVLPSSISSTVTLNSSLSDESTESTKRTKRRTLLDVVFTRSNNSARSVFKTTKEELGFDSSFTKDNLLVYKNNQTIDMNAVDTSLGVYANIYGSGETATFLNVGGSQTVVFTAGGDGTYTATLDGESTGETYSAGSSYDIAGYTWTMGSVYTEGEAAGNVCLGKNTDILTSKGYVAIPKINKQHKVMADGRKTRVYCLVKRTNPTEIMVQFDTHSVDFNIPYKTTIMTMNHGVMYKGKWYMAKDLVNNTTIRLIKVNKKHQFIYNVLLNEKRAIYANGMIVESLDPTNDVAKSHYPPRTFRKLLLKSKNKLAQQQLSLLNSTENEDNNNNINDNELYDDSPPPMDYQY